MQFFQLLIQDFLANSEIDLSVDDEFSEKS
jgi:hypothetical protein